MSALFAVSLARPAQRKGCVGRMGFFAALGISMAAIFVSELGDKTQLMAMALAARFRAATVLVGVTVATLAVHGVSVLIGEVLGAALPTDWITLVAGLAFVFFGVWTLRGDDLTPKDEARASSRRFRSGLITVCAVFFLAELGDKSMLATVTLGTQYPWLPVWVGSTIGMVAADALAIALGAVLAKKLPDRAIQIAAAVSFFVFGAALLFQGIRMVL